MLPDEGHGAEVIKGYADCNDMDEACVDNALCFCLTSGPTASLQVSDGIWIGNIASAENTELLIANKITGPLASW